VTPNSDAADPFPTACWQQLAAVESAQGLLHSSSNTLPSSKFCKRAPEAGCVVERETDGAIATQNQVFDRLHWPVAWRGTITQRLSFLEMIDDFSDVCEIVPIAGRKRAMEALKDFVVAVERHRGKRLTLYAGR
jgi:hypothetical protein